VTSALTKTLRAAAAGAATFSMGAVAPPSAVALKAAARTVLTFLATPLLTVSIALPA
jgi:hypothetical protein